VPILSRTSFSSSLISIYSKAKSVPTIFLPLSMSWALLSCKICLYFAADSGSIFERVLSNYFSLSLAFFIASSIFFCSSALCFICYSTVSGVFLLISSAAPILCIVVPVESAIYFCSFNSFACFCRSASAIVSIKLISCTYSLSCFNFSASTIVFIKFY